ncbi:hypothetical protein GQ53DRAFT_336806 [Thozetella sp. PMI_491]|nr:hypothetical protein GQ53DRAFT_336806 [Thozetella sp. PMI_491]
MAPAAFFCLLPPRTPEAIDVYLASVCVSTLPLPSTASDYNLVENPFGSVDHETKQKGVGANFETPPMANRVLERATPDADALAHPNLIRRIIRRKRHRRIFDDPGGRMGSALVTVFTSVFSR